MADPAVEAALTAAIIIIDDAALIEVVVSQVGWPGCAAGNDSK
jgi:hypothetical protein